jgi:hypothetical protein
MPKMSEGHVSHERVKLRDVFDKLSEMYLEYTKPGHEDVTKTYAISYQLTCAKNYLDNIDLGAWELLQAGRMMEHAARMMGSWADIEVKTELAETIARLGAYEVHSDSAV